MPGHYRTQGTARRPHVIAAGLLLPLVAWGARPVQAITFPFDFAASDHGWTAGFADYPVGQEEAYGLTAERRSLPAEVGEGLAWYLSGRNMSDDLWMGLQRPVDGLLPSTPYRVWYDVQLASAYPEGSVGIGGSPAHSVWLKAGAAPEQAQTVVDAEGIYRLTVDKGNQADGGAHALVLGDIAKPDDGTDEYVTIERRSPAPLVVTSSPDGRLWLLLGTDSGFEGTTSLYYQRVVVTIEPVPEPAGGALAALGLGILAGWRRIGRARPLRGGVWATA